ncbi:tRNA(Ile)-lysidine synthetase [Chryseobacterium piperi]|uniref:tRNA(Ile)-lysidine synthase n=2 Tax=Chryseobacterium piperi TaxID=558152 RepID=A0A086BLT0_9FLAO|nr:tRNA(Ile)-lysidine synthetase [Chryseobacterium piperi]KFF29894.1 tRNA(Ile)-lysidine synthetase [Chryseobacterium piperi]
MLKKLSIKDHLAELVQSPENNTYLLGVSGGADSMVLASLFLDSGIPFEIAHINYKLRGNDSDLDQKVVQDFCDKSHIKFHLYEVSEKDHQPENSIQLWAREIRYRFFKKIQEKEDLKYLVTAHHLNDQLETFIINLSKASGINGLSGIPANDNKILRPLLSYSKEEIYAFAQENNIEYREDLSNKKSDYLRNKIRNEIVPKLLETNDHFLENFKKTSSYLNQTKDFVRKQIQDIENNLSSFNLGNRILSKEKLNKESDFVRFEILKKYGFGKEEEIKKIFTAETGSSFFSNEYQLVINRDELIIINRHSDQESNQEIILIEKSDFNPMSIDLNIKDFIQLTGEDNKNFQWSFDMEKIQFPLVLRRKQEGDLFYPLNFSGKKKVSKFFKDEKLSILAKQKIWVLADGNKNVLGVIPYRQDRRFVCTEKTRYTLNLFNQK